MANITVAEALEFASANFPKAPEKLAAHLQIEIKESMLNCDGWCLQIGTRSIIRINNDEKIPKTRKRFTLAHELGHLILGIPSLIGESMLETSVSTTQEEKEVNKFASEFLLPESIVLKEFKELPITATKLKKFAKRARVSDLVIARRIALLTQKLGLKNASVLFFKNGKFNYQLSETLEVPRKFANDILPKCEAVSPKPLRIAYEEGSVIVASSLENPTSITKIIFLQIVDDEIGFRQLSEEKIKELSKAVFQNDDNFRNILNGRFGGFKKIAQNLELDDAVRLFNERLNEYPDSLKARHLTILNSKKGQEFIRLKLQYL